MNVNSFSFVVFVGILAFLYYFPVMKKIQWIVLLAGSYVFYAQAGVDKLVYILITTLVTYLAARVVDSKNTLQEEYIRKNKGILSKGEIKQYKENIKKQKHRVIILCIAVNLGLLFLLKYGEFLAGNAGHILGHPEWS